MSSRRSIGLIVLILGVVLIIFAFYSMNYPLPEKSEEEVKMLLLGGSALIIIGGGLSYLCRKKKSKR